MYDSVLNAFRRAISSLVVPQTCLVCGEPAEGGCPLCTNCLENRLVREVVSLAREPESSRRCRKCGIPLVSAEGLCYTCRTTHLLTSIDRIIPLFPYTVTGQELLVSWKIRGVRSLSSVFARLLADFLRGSSELRNLSVIPVPPRPGKRAEKGWDQIEELASFLSRSQGIPILNCLARTSGVQQKKLGKAARFSNIHGHIVVKPTTPVPAAAIVLDDLVTTGSTLDACADALKCAGCGKVYGLTLFYD